MTARRVRFDIRQTGRLLLMVFVAVLAVNVVAYFLLVRPKTREYGAIMDGTDQRVVDLKTRRDTVESAEDYLNKLQQAQADLGDLRSDVLSTRDLRMVEVQGELEHLCAQFKINLDSVNYDNDTQPVEQLDRMAMVVPLEGGYTALRQFLQAVESSDKFLVVERVALGEGQEGGVQLLLNITLATYFNLPQSEGRPRVPPRRPARRA